MDVRNQHLHNARLQREWAALAMNDAKYNERRAEDERKAGNRVLADQYAREAEVDRQWYSRRMRIATHERVLAGINR